MTVLAPHGQIARRLLIEVWQQLPRYGAADVAAGRITVVTTTAGAQRRHDDERGEKHPAARTPVQVYPDATLLVLKPPTLRPAIKPAKRVALLPNAVLVERGLS